MFLKFSKERGALRCPFCRDPIYPAPSVIRCLKCKTVHHEKCWEDRGSCSIYGCKGTPQLELTDLFFIELFQKRRKKLRNSKFAAAITALIVSTILFFVLKPVLPVEGRLIFSFAVILFLSIVIVLGRLCTIFMSSLRSPTKSNPKVLSTRRVVSCSGFKRCPRKVEGR